MTTKIPVELSSTPGIADSSNATAITISSSEQVMIGTTDAGYADYGDSLTVGDVDGGGGNAGMTIRSGTSSYGTFYFSDATGTAAGTYAGKMQYNHSNNSMVFGTNSSDKLTIDSSGNVGIGTTSPSVKLEVNGDVKLGATNPVQISTNVMHGTSGSDGFYVRTAVSSAANPTFSNIDDINTGMFFPAADTVGFTTAGSERMRIDSAGDVIVGDTAVIRGSSQDGVSIETEGRIYLSRGTGTGGFSHLAFYNGNGLVGHITSTNAATAYSTSSDYRLKENISYEFDALSRVAQLKPARFNFIAHKDMIVDGFLAHEVTDIVPEAITGEKDAVDDEGNAIYQGIDQSKLVPLLTKAIQELSAKVEELESKINE